jgi:hypothetical protein
MTDIKVPSAGNARIFWGPDGSFANPAAPTVAEITALTDLTDAISWNDFGFGMNNSNTSSDPAMSSLGKVLDRGMAQFGGKISFYYPKNFDDTTNKYSTVYDLMAIGRNTGYIVIRIDGRILTSGTATSANPVKAVAAGDIVHVFKVKTDAYSETIKGDNAFRYTVEFLPQGIAAPRVVVRPTVSTGYLTTISPATLTGSLAAGKYKLSASIDGRTYTNGMTWTTSDPTKATVSKAGVVKILASTGTVTITATYPGGGTAGTCTITLAV